MIKFLEGGLMNEWGWWKVLLTTFIQFLVTMYNINLKSTVIVQLKVLK